MNIQGIELTKFHEGEQVTYIPPHAKGNACHKDSERGRIKRWNDTFVFVDYIRNICATRPEDLVWG